MSSSWANAVVLIPPDPAVFGGTLLVPGDQIVALGPDGACVGTSVWDGTGTALVLWADDPTTTAADGLAPGDPFSFAVYPPEEAGRSPETVTFQFRPEFAPDEGFHPDGAYVVSPAGGATPTGPDPEAETTLGLVHPNPVAQSARVPLSLAAAAEVEAHVYDALGRHVAVLFRGRLDAGDHGIPLDASALASGTYVCRVQTGGTVRQRRFTVAR